jgi:anti-anti-sigma regulatory factor
MDAGDGDRLFAAVSDKLDTATRTVTIDLSKLDHVSLGAIRAVLRLGRSLKDSDRALDFSGGSGAVRHAFEQAGFHDFFQFTPPLHPHRGHHDDETP